MKTHPIHRRAKTAFVPTLLAAIVILAVAFVIGMLAVDKVPDPMVPLASIAVVATAVVIAAAHVKKQGVDITLNLLKTAIQAMKQILAPTNQLALTGPMAYNDTGQATDKKPARLTTNHHRGRHVDRRDRTGTDKTTTSETMGAPLKV